MKLYGFYEHDDIGNLEFNHRKFCDLNNIQYNKIQVQNYNQKFHHIYDILQNNIGDTLLFIDSYSYFKSFNLSIDITNDIMMQVKDGILCDNFFIVKSNEETLRIFKDILLWVSENYYSYSKFNFVFNLNDYYEFFDIIPNLLDYPYIENNIYFNVDSKFHDNFLSIGNILVVYTRYQSFYSPSNILCDYKQSDYEFREGNFEIINPGHKKAFISLYTDNIKEQGIISEMNIERYCISNDITFIVYRDTPSNISKMRGNWCKPYILLHHIDNYEYICWLDSDIIITEGYHVDFKKDIRVFNDPSNWFFNSGFMMFKSIDKNKRMLEYIIENIEKDLELIYSNSGDQLYFIKAFRIFYPDELPESAIHTNLHIDICKPSIKKMVHFMGIPINIRHIVMEYYDNKYGYILNKR